MRQMLEYADGRQVTLAQFRSEHKNEMYAGNIPPQSVLDRYAATLVTVPDPVPVITSEQVSAERDRRGLLDFTWNGIDWQGDERSTKKIMGLVTNATIYLTIGGGDPLETKWVDGVNNFKFTAKDDSEHILTAPAMIQMGQALAARVNFLHRKAKDIKAMDPIPVDYQTNEALWS